MARAKYLSMQDNLDKKKKKIEPGGGGGRL